MEIKIRLQTLNDTKNLAKELSKKLNIGDTLLLKGDLGSGKTTLTKYLLEELGVKEIVNSPTFVIMKNYQGKFPIYHIDAYRLENQNDDLGFQELLENGLLVIEWPEYLEKFWHRYIEVKIKYLNEFEREVEIYQGDYEVHLTN